MTTKRNIKNKSSTMEYYISNKSMSYVKKLHIILFKNVRNSDAMHLRFVLFFALFLKIVTSSDEISPTGFEIIQTCKTTGKVLESTKLEEDYLVPSKLTNSISSATNNSENLEDLERINLEHELDFVSLNSSCEKDESEEFVIIDVDGTKNEKSIIFDIVSIENFFMLVLEDSYEGDSTQVILSSNELFVRILNLKYKGRDLTTNNSIRQRFIRLFNAIVKKGVEILFRDVLFKDYGDSWEILKDYMDIEPVKRFVVTMSLKSILMLRICDELNDLVLKNNEENSRRSKNSNSLSNNSDVYKKLEMLFENSSKFLMKCKTICEKDYSQTKNSIEKLENVTEIRFKWLTNKVFSCFFKNQIEKLQEMQNMGSIKDFYESHNYCIFKEFILFIFLEIISVERLNDILSEEFLTSIGHYETTDSLQEYMKTLMLVIKKEYDMDLENKIKPKSSSYVPPINGSDFLKFLHQKLKKIHPFFSYMNIESNFISCSLSFLFSKKKGNEMNKKLKKIQVIREASDEELYKLENVKDIFELIDVVFKEFMGYSTLEERIKFYQTHYKIMFDCKNSLNFPKIVSEDCHQSYHELFYYYIMRIDLVISYLSIHKFNFHLITSKKNAVVTKFNKSEIEKNLEYLNESQKTEKFCNFYYNFYFNKIMMDDLDSYKKDCKLYTNIYKKNLKDFQIFYKPDLYFRENYCIHFKEMAFFIDDIAKGLLNDSMQDNICYEKFFYFFKSEIYIDHYLVIAKNQINNDSDQNEEINTFYKFDSCYFFGKNDTDFNGNDSLKTIRLELHEIIYLSSYFKKNLLLYNHFWKMKKHTEITTIINVINNTLDHNYSYFCDCEFQDLGKFLLNHERVKEYLIFLEKFQRGKNAETFEFLYKSFIKGKQKLENRYNIEYLKSSKNMFEFEYFFMTKFKYFINDSHKLKNQAIKKLENILLDSSISLEERIKMSKEIKTELIQIFYDEKTGLENQLRLLNDSKLNVPKCPLDPRELGFHEEIKISKKNSVEQMKKFTNKLSENIIFWNFNDGKLLEDFGTSLNKIFEKFILSDLENKESKISKIKKHINELLEITICCDFVDQNYPRREIEEYINGIVVRLKSYDFVNKDSIISEIEEYIKNNIFYLGYLNHKDEVTKIKNDKIVDLFIRNIEEMKKEMNKFEDKIDKRLKRTGMQIYRNICFQMFKFSKEKIFFQNLVKYFSEHFNLKTGVFEDIRDNEFMRILKENNNNFFDLDQNEMITSVNIIAFFEAFMEEFEKCDADFILLKRKICNELGMLAN